MVSYTINGQNFAQVDLRQRRRAIDANGRLTSVWDIFTVNAQGTESAVLDTTCAPVPGIQEVQ